MNTTENELQALKEEFNALRDRNFALYEDLSKQNEMLLEQIISLRQENIALCKELARHHTVLNGAISFFGGGSRRDHLEKYLKRLAGMQTAQFIANNMPKVKSFDDRESYFEYILNHIESAVGGGEYLEFGVFKGGSINFISKTLPDKIIYGFDSFEGLPEDWQYKAEKGCFNLNGNLPQVNKNVRLIKGWFDETLPDFVKAHPEPCAFIHIDSDLYSSAKTVLDTLKNKIVAGTVIAFDEYFNYTSWQEGEYKAFMEFVEENHLKFEYIARTNFEQVAVKIK